MDRLILFRHAKAESESSSGDDFDRPLALRGRREAQAMGVQLAALGRQPDLALVSPAVRARETWEIAEEALGPVQLRLEPSLYNAEAGAILALADAVGAGRGTVIVVAHNPGLQDLAVRLLREASAPAAVIARALRDFPPAALAAFHISPDGDIDADGLFFPERLG